MSLRKCLECGKDVSSRAPACPHCGRLSSKSRFPIETAAGLGLAVVWLLASAWHSSWTGEMVREGVAPTAPPETAIARPYRQLEQGLTAVVGYNRTLNLFRIENRDTFSWANCQASLNSRGISGYELGVKSIKPGLADAALLQSAEFADPDGRSFDPSTDKVATLDLDCETPRGHLYYGGKFVPDGSRSSADGGLVVSTRTALNR